MTKKVFMAEIVRQAETYDTLDNQWEDGEKIFEPIMNHMMYRTMLCKQWGYRRMVWFYEWKYFYNFCLC